MANILVVEDERVIADHLQLLLEILGHTVVGNVATGTEAIAAIKRICPDLVIMDIRLRGEMDGIATAEKIYSMHQIPVVYLTAHADEDTLQRAKVPALYGYVIKPFQRKELQVAIEVALYRHQIEQQLRTS